MLKLVPPSLYLMAKKGKGKAKAAVDAKHGIMHALSKGAVASPSPQECNAHVFSLYGSFSNTSYILFVYMSFVFCYILIYLL